MKKTRRGYNFSLVYLLVFLLSIADAVVGYTQSSFLNQFFSLSNVGLVVGACSLMAIIVSAWLPKLISKNSAYKVGVGLTIINIICALVLTFSRSPMLVFIFFLTRYLGFMFLLTVLDIFLEKISSDKTTGLVRSTYLTIINLAWLLSPWLMGRLVGDNNYGRIYLFGSLITSLLLIILILNRKKLKNVKPEATLKTFGAFTSLKQLFRSRDLLATFSAVMALNVFYAVAVLYVPIYLNQNLGFSWQTIGFIFTIMLLPFVLIQLPAGMVADKYWGEKEMMMAGNVIMAGCSAIIFLATSREVVFWAGLLFFSRVGAALAESMQEIYFYKKISIKNVGLISFFRQARSLGWLLGALLAFALLKFIDIKGLFLTVAIILIINTLHLSFIKDTK